MVVGALFMLLWFSAPVRAQWQWQGSAEVYAPNNGLLDKAVGGELKLVYWHKPYWGLALCTGVSQWSVDTTRDTVASIPNSYERSHTWDGNVQYVPLGLSVMARTVTPQQNTLLWEAGVRHMAATSNIELLETERVWSAPSQFTEFTTAHPVDSPDGLVGRIGVGATWRLDQQWRCLAAGGFQFDLDQNDATVDGLSVQKELDLTAFYFQLGLIIQWR